MKMIVEPKTLFVDVPADGWRLQSGATLPELHIQYETYGTLNTQKDNGIFVCAPLTADAHAAGYYSDSDTQPGWWDPLIGPGKAIDTDRFFVICCNNLGGCRGTSGPASINPLSQKPYGSSFPHFTIKDMVNVQKEVIDFFGISKLWGIIGGSMGGLQALTWSIEYPEAVEKIIVIAATTHLSAQALGFEILGRQAIVADPDFANGDYYESGPPATGLSLARKIAHLTYLSSTSMEKKFERGQALLKNPKVFHTDFEVESYLNHQGEKFVHRFDANSYLHITWAMDHFDLNTEYGTLQDALCKIKGDLLNINVSSDWLFPPEESRRICAGVANARGVVSNVELNSPWGHDAFLLEVDELGEVIQRFLTDEKVAAPEDTLENYRANPLYRVVSAHIPPGKRFLDLGCGAGGLIDYIWQEKRSTGLGVDLDSKKILGCLEKNVPVLQIDLDEGLHYFADDSFDMVVLNRTLEQVKNPLQLVREMLRVAPEAIVAFPNFGHYKTRAFLLLHGRMPTNEDLPYDWYDTPNIHLFTLRDLRYLCKQEGIHIVDEHYINKGLMSQFLCAVQLPNLGAESVVLHLKR
jgi:homoserine O-acetyltransferase/O-succinyltransferase